MMRETRDDTSHNGATASDASQSLDLEKGNVNNPNHDNLDVFTTEDFELDRVLTEHSLAHAPSLHLEESKNIPEDQIVDWDGEDDPENPHNWPRRKKLTNVVTIAVMTFLAPLSSSAYAPGLPQVEKEFHTSQWLTTFSLSAFLLGFGVGPLIWGPLSETFGRKPVYLFAYSIFAVLNVGCALSTSIDMLISIRVFSGFFGAVSIANSAATISDCYTAIQRTKVIAWYVFLPMASPVIGPIIAGFIVEYLEWRWVFWILLIMASFNVCLCFVFLTESYAPTILAKKAKRLEQEYGRKMYPRFYDPRPVWKRIAVAIQRPFRILLLQPLVFLLATYMTLIYGIVYLLFSTFPYVFEQRYGFSSSLVGLAYIGVGCGFMSVLLFGIPIMDKIFRRLTAKNNNVSLPEFRIPFMYVGSFCLPISLLWYGWSVQANAQFMVPIIGTYFFGVAMISIFNAAQQFMIDSFTRYAASAIAAGAMLRSVVGGALFSLWGPIMFDAVGYGVGFTILAAAGVLMMPLPYIIWRYGAWFRKRFPVKLE